MPFRFNAKRAFLTYPHSDFDPLLLAAHINTFAPLSHYAFTTEQHHDGSPHIHFLCEFVNKFSTRNERAFDFEGRHPNIRTVSSLKNTLNYVKKSGSFFSNFPQAENTFLDALQSSTTKDEFLENILRSETQKAICSWSNIVSFAEDHFSRLQQCTHRTISDFQAIPEDLGSALSEFIAQPQVERPHSIIISGPSRTGKTELARSLGSHSYWCGMVDLSNFCPNQSLYLVIDDLDWDFAKSWFKQLLGCNKTVTLTDTYRRKRTFTWGKPCLVLCNPGCSPYEASWVKHGDRQWLDANVKQFWVESPIF